jgi:pantothenate kinase
VERVTWAGGAPGPLLDRALGLLDSGRRSVLGIAGAPASGKSTLAETVLAEVNRLRPGSAVLVGMDAYHLGHALLQARGWTPVKGAPQTFDALGYVALLRRIRESSDVVYAPEFHREIEDSISAAVEVGRDVRLVITEGNYLLLPQAPWDQVRPLLDEAWFVLLDDDERRRRMVTRHQRFGHSLEEATARTNGSDEANAQLVNRAQNAPDLFIEHLFDVV